MDKSQAVKFVRDLLSLMVKQKASDLFITMGVPPSIKLNGKITPVSKTALTPVDVEMLVRGVMNDRQLKEYGATKECNFALSPEGVGRFRVSAFYQQSCPGMVMRVIESKVPTLDKLGLPDVLKDITLSKNGLVIVVGATGSGKSTSLAAMVDYRNQNSYGHILTIEDPIEYVHQHKNCIVTQREVGIDTEDWGVALKNALRQAPDVILLGEVRDRKTMEFAVEFSETGHLAMATLHANNSNQALDRIINFFPEERRLQLLMDMSLNIKAIISQRLLKSAHDKGRVAAIEIMLNTPLVSDLILKGEVTGIKTIMAKSNELGMQTFDQALYDLYERDLIFYEEALRNADSANELRLKIKLQSEKEGGVDIPDGSEHLILQGDDESGDDRYSNLLPR